MEFILQAAKNIDNHDVRCQANSEHPFLTFIALRVVQDPASTPIWISFIFEIHKYFQNKMWTSTVNDQYLQNNVQTRTQTQPMQSRIPVNCHKEKCETGKIWMTIFHSAREVVWAGKEAAQFALQERVKSTFRRTRTPICDYVVGLRSRAWISIRFLRTN